MTTRDVASSRVGVTLGRIANRVVDSAAVVLAVGLSAPGGRSRGNTTPSLRELSPSREYGG